MSNVLFHTYGRLCFLYMISHVNYLVFNTNNQYILS